MSASKIDPEKITNPMQLMAAWFVMLVSLVSVLLTAAANITEPTWITSYLVISSTILICGVLCCVFLMLTVYRPHLQDSEKYAVWLKDKNRYGNSVQKVAEDKFKEQPQELRFPEGKTPEEQIAFLKKVRFCNVDIVATKDAKVVAKNLSEEGYSVSLYDEVSEDSNKHSLSNSTGIWVGTEISPEVVLRAIKIALKTWPQLQYIHLSEDSEGPDYTHTQLFLGGDHGAVQRLKLEPWSIKEINEVPIDISIDDFHQRIREKYS